MISKNNTPIDTLLIITRFFAALHRLKDERKLKGIQTFCRAHGINRRNMYTLEHNVEGHSGIFDAAWLAYIVRDHNVSSHWLLTGEGEFYNPEMEEKTQNQRNLFDGVV